MFVNANASGSRQYTFGASFPKTYIPATAIVTPPAFNLGEAISTLASSCAPIAFFCFCALMFFGIPILTFIGDRRRKLQYMSPKIAIEGHGIKRGLTAVEAFHSEHDAVATEHYLSFAERHGVLVSGGSDYHGEKERRKAAFGTIGLPQDRFERLKARVRET